METEIKMEWPLYSGVKYNLGTVTLKTSNGEEFKVNGQRLKQCLKRNMNDS